MPESPTCTRCLGCRMIVRWQSRFDNEPVAVAIEPCLDCEARDHAEQVYPDGGE